jgi:hypothetical protein
MASASASAFCACNIRQTVDDANSPEQTKLRIQLEGRLTQRFERRHWVYNPERAGFKMEIPGKHKRRKHGDHTTFRAQGRRRCTVRQRDQRSEGSWDLAPEGLTYHVASGMGADFKVFEVWESEQHARNFGERLKPILQKYKIELPHEPRPQPVKNTIKGKSL